MTSLGEFAELVDDELHLAVRVGDLEATNNALEQGFDPNKIGLFEWSSQHEAAHNGDYEILKVLLEYGGDCNRRDLLNGSTALHYAAAEGHPQCLELLLSNGGDVTIENDKGQSAPQITRHKGCKEVFAKYGIDVTTSVHFEDQPTNSSESNTNNKKKSDPQRNSKKHSANKGQIVPPPSSFQKNSWKSTMSDESYESGIGSKTSLTDTVSNSSIYSSSRSPGIKGDGQSITSDTASASSPCSKSYSSFGSLTSIGSSILSGNDDCAGYITMAFQYNRKTSHLKIRIIEIVLTCLLPFQKSRKDASLLLHVGGVMQNEKEERMEKNQPPRMRAKSEAFKLHPGGDQSNPVQENDGCVQTFWCNKTAHVQFKSSLGVEFVNVTKQVVQDHSIQVSVCTRQKRNLLKNTNHSIPLATMELSLKQAVKRLMKETYELQMCHAPGVTRNPERLEQVLSEIVIDGGKVRCPSVSSDLVIQGNYNESFQMEEIDRRSASDGDLKQVSSSINSKTTSPSSSSYDIQEGTESDDDYCLEEVKSHYVPTSPQVKIKVPMNIKNNISAETKMDIPIEEYKDSDSGHRKGTGQHRSNILNEFGSKLHQLPDDRKKSLRRFIISRNQSISADEEMGSQENIPMTTLSTSDSKHFGYSEQKFTSVTYEKGDTNGFSVPRARSPKVIRSHISRHIRTQSNDSAENVNENTQSYYKRNKEAIPLQ